MAINHSQAHRILVADLIPAYQKSKGEEKEILNTFFVDVDNIDESKLNQLSIENQKIVQQLIDYFNSDDLTLALRRQDSEGLSFGIMRVLAWAIVENRGETLRDYCEYNGKAVDIE